MHYPDLQSGRAYLPQVFDFRELQLATRGFNPRDLVGEGGFGKVFKAVLTDGRVVAVKQLDRGRSQGDKEFWVEVTRYLLPTSGLTKVTVKYCRGNNQKIMRLYQRAGGLKGVFPVTVSYELMPSRSNETADCEDVLRRRSC